MIYKGRPISTKITDDIKQYIKYLMKNGFKRVRIHKVHGHDAYVYVYWREEPNILAVFSDFKWEFSDGSGDGHLSLNVGYYHVCVSDLCYDVIGMSRSKNQLCFNCRYDINDIIRTFRKCIVKWDDRLLRFGVDMWHHAVIDDNLSLNSINNLNKLHNQIWEKLPTKFQSIIPAKKYYTG